MRLWILMTLGTILLAIAGVQLGTSTLRILLLIYLGGFALLYAYALIRSLILTCVRGVPAFDRAKPCRAIEPVEIPGPTWDALQRVQEPIPATGALHLGYLRVASGLIVQYCSAWSIDDGAIVLYGCAQVFEFRAGEHTPQNEFVICASGTPAGDQIQTINLKNAPSLDRDGNSIRSYPPWMPVASLLQIHRARIAATGVSLRRAHENIAAIVELNNEAHRRWESIVFRGLREGTDGRIRARFGAWALAVIAQLPPISTILRLRWRAIARRELRTLGLLHLWSKPD